MYAYRCHLHMRLAEVQKYRVFKYGDLQAVSAPRRRTYPFEEESSVVHENEQCDVLEYGHQVSEARTCCGVRYITSFTITVVVMSPYHQFHFCGYAGQWSWYPKSNLNPFNTSMHLFMSDIYIIHTDIISPPFHSPSACNDRAKSVERP